MAQLAGFSFRRATETRVTVITVLQLLVLMWGCGLAALTVFAEPRAGRDRNTDVQLLALWILLFLGWLK